jgi:hypothetical protein
VPITIWVMSWIPLRRGVLDTTLCDKVSELRQVSCFLHQQNWILLSTLNQNHISVHVLSTTVHCCIISCCFVYLFFVRSFMFYYATFSVLSVLNWIIPSFGFYIGYHSDRQYTSWLSKHFKYHVIVRVKVH